VGLPDAGRRRLPAGGPELDEGLAAPRRLTGERAEALLFRTRHRLAHAGLPGGRAGLDLLADHGLEVVGATCLQVDEEAIAKVWRFRAAGFHPDRWPPATDQRPDRVRKARHGRPGVGVIWPWTGASSRCAG
jgi:hypothetical protein